MTNKKVAIITGASSGFGELTAGAFGQKGYRVFGTSCRERSAAPQNVEMLVLDVQSDQSVLACIENLLALTNRIDLLVNNAGQAHASVIEETSSQEGNRRFRDKLLGCRSCH